MPILMSHPCHNFVAWLNRKHGSASLVFLWGNLNAHGMQLNKGRRWFRLLASGVTIISCETPVIGREHFEQCDRVEPYFRMGIFNTSTLHRGGFAIPDNADASRLDAILQTTGMTMTDQRSTGEAVLYCLQVPGDTSLQGTDVELAAMYDLTELIRTTSRPIIVVTHPFARQGISRLQSFCSRQGIRFEPGPARQYFDEAFCTVTQSSSAAIDGILAGVPAVTLHAGSFARPCSVHAIADLESASLAGCREWLCRLAYVQFQPVSEVEVALKTLQNRAKKNFPFF